ncbi:MAG: helix-turn-helix domain-containing protein [Evtepia sp.]|uniref:helix-turn-helix domain-containing protein n=1 Tax=Evtepia sp. TaxID=2773933 RepID=UPI002A76675B|nr:helix-turn-helix domain-containing protein [Evtepia sp.]MDY3013921.1 helix-turn-helix domain-containing protein [Evtepia sp.]
MPSPAIPFDRQALADYLGVDRSALSKELGKMRREGLVETRKNHFRLLSSACPPEEQ